MRKRAGSWRPLSAPGSEFFFLDHDAVIVSNSEGRGGRGNSYEVYTYGQLISTRESLVDAKYEVEMVYGPLDWRQISMPDAKAIHYYFGPTTEFTDPTTIYVVDRLPQL